MVFNQTSIFSGCSFVIVILQLTANNTSLRWYHVITWILFNIYITVAYIITVSYWVGVGFDLIAPAKSAASANFHVHVMNSVLATIELAVGNLPVRILHCYCPMIFGLVYLFFTLILHWSGDLSSIYAVLDWMGGPGMAAGYALGILFVAVPVFHLFATWGITQFRLFVHSSCFAHSSPGSTNFVRSNDQCSISNV